MAKFIYLNKSLSEKSKGAFVNVATIESIEQRSNGVTITTVTGQIFKEEGDIIAFTNFLKGGTEPTTMFYVSCESG